MRLINVIGQKFGKLTVRAMLPSSECVCECECGRALITESYSVRKGLTKSCGCDSHSHCNLTHGESRKGKWTPEYRAWVNMITRCCNPNSTRYRDWGGRGIAVCVGWRLDYSAFLAYVGRKPTPQHSLDRYPDPNGNYEPGNVRWATKSEQVLNQRPRRRTR